MLVTARKDLWQRAWAYKDHGKSFAAVQDAQRSGSYEFKWLHESFGSNFRMTEMQAAIGRVQLRKLPAWVAARRRNAALLDEGLGTVPGVRVAVPLHDYGHSYYKYYAFVDPQHLAPGWDVLRVIEAINAEGVPCIQGACNEIYREKAFTGAGLGPPAPLAVASQLARSSLMFMLHPTLDSEDMRDTVRATAKVMRVATGAHARPQ